ncbi:MAG: hypothetical protein ABSE81_02570 [Candidatus Omnitrophota bacterium]|jgi:O-antigen/teichoic acid export membrane protein
MTIPVWGLIIAAVTAIVTIIGVFWQINKDLNEARKKEREGLIVKPSLNQIQKYGFPLIIPFIVFLIIFYLLFRK